jgi:hypothetical protein
MNMFEFRVFWDKWRIAFDRVEYEGYEEPQLYVLYIGPLVFAYHRDPGE